MSLSSAETFALWATVPRRSEWSELPVSRPVLSRLVRATRVLSHHVAAVGEATARHEEVLQRMGDIAQFAAGAPLLTPRQTSAIRRSFEAAKESAKVLLGLRTQGEVVCWSTESLDKVDRGIAKARQDERSQERLRKALAQRRVTTSPFTPPGTSRWEAAHLFPKSRVDVSDISQPCLA